MLEVTDSRWYKMVDAHMSKPYHFSEKNVLMLKKGFVYDREFGLFSVSAAYHSIAMALLLAFHNNELSAIDNLAKLKLKSIEGAADYFLKSIKGTAFHSSVGDKTITYAGKPGNLTIAESRIFGKVEYLFWEEEE